MGIKDKDLYFKILQRKKEVNKKIITIFAVLKPLFMVLFIVFSFIAMYLNVTVLDEKIGSFSKILLISFFILLLFFKYYDDKIRNENRLLDRKIYDLLKL